ncbi:hypothetical protein VCR8J2_190120 [Vibrio coralliirubri]|nr:hypothetical protein VCR8J2_190120 [Vibrio coralliirubri]
MSHWRTIYRKKSLIKEVVYGLLRLGTVATGRVGNGMDIGSIDCIRCRHRLNDCLG